MQGLATDRLNAYSSDQDVQSTVDQTIAFLLDLGYPPPTAQAIANHSASVATNRPPPGSLPRSV